MSFNLMKHQIDALIRKIVTQSVRSRRKWLRETFEMCLRIKAHRGTHDYGFEWAIQTLIGEYLLRDSSNLSISDIRLNQPHPTEPGRKPDILFRHEGREVVLELKTVLDCDLSYSKRDVRKNFPQSSIVYFLVISYPSKRKTDRELEGAWLV